jgi:phosphate-selective porin OprO/OprP
VFAATSAFDKGFDSKRDDDFQFFDYRLDIPVFDRTNVSVGMQKEPISMERIMSMVNLPMQERSAVADALLPSRNFGVVLSGTARNQRMTWAGGVFNDWLVTSDSYGNSSSQFIGRVTWLPFVSEDESNLFHLGFGARYSTVKEGGQALTEPEFNNAPAFVDTGLIVADSTIVYDLEASWRKGRFWLAGEYLGSDLDSPTAGDPEFGGYHITGSWVLSGEMRAYNKKSGILGKVPVAKSVYQGGWGAWEVGARWSELDLTEGTVDGGEMQIASVGLNWWLSPIFNVNLNYRHIGLDRFGLQGAAHGFNTRVMLVLE